MELPLQILLGLTALIWVAGGLNLLIKGAKHFLPKTIPSQQILDNLIRFLSGIYFSMSFLLAWAVINIHEILISFISLGSPRHIIKYNVPFIKI